MSRNFALLCLVFVAAWAVAAEPEAKKPAGQGPLDYSSWKPLTKEPIRVDRRIFERCDRPASTERAAKVRGPHFAPAVKVFANPTAAETLQSHPNATLPIGAMIVKEKFWNEKDVQPTAYTAMIKSEPGFDAEHGDWEYLYVELDEKPVVTRGVIKSCVQCHSLAKDKDYLFRTYLSVPMPAAMK